jgi:L-amino acid N-acyltransferase YncA
VTNIRVANPADAEASTDIDAPIVASTSISFGWAPPSVDEMRGWIANTPADLPWLVSDSGGMPSRGKVEQSLSV